MSKDDVPWRRRLKNVLYILADDLRPEFRFTNPETALYTPSFDQLAREGSYFGLAFSQVAFCVPSRTSFLTGLRPEVTGSIHNDQLDRFGDARNAPLRPGWTVFDDFQRAGFLTAAVGKIFHFAEDHPGIAMKAVTETNDLLGRPCDTANATNILEPESSSARRFGFPKVCDLPFGAFVDERVAAMAVSFLRRLQQTKQPWLLAAGFQRPHNPYQYPRSWLDIQASENATDVPTVASRYPGQPGLAYADSPVCNSRSCMRAMRRFYRGAVSHLDSLVGLVLYEVRRLNVENSTIIGMHADHSFSLGENGAWQKRTMFDHSSRVPLFIKDMSIPSAAGLRIVEHPVELLDVLPTLLDLSGAFDENKLPARLQGRSLRSLLEQRGRLRYPSAQGLARVDAKHTYAFMVQPRMLYLPRGKRRRTHMQPPLIDGLMDSHMVSVNSTDMPWGASSGTTQDAAIIAAILDTFYTSAQASCTDNLARGFGPGRACQIVAMGFSVRSHRWRYTRWERRPLHNISGTQIWSLGGGMLLAEELYNYSSVGGVSRAAMSDGSPECINLAHVMNDEVRKVKRKLFRVLLVHYSNAKGEALVRDHRW